MFLRSEVLFLFILNFYNFQITIKKKIKVNKNKITNQKNKNSLKIKFFIIYLAYKHKKNYFYLVSQSKFFLV